MKLTDKQLEIEKFTKEMLNVVNQYKQDIENGLTPKEYIAIDRKYLDYLFGKEKENVS